MEEKCVDMRSLRDLNDELTEVNNSDSSNDHNATDEKFISVVPQPEIMQPSVADGIVDQADQLRSPDPVTGKIVGLRRSMSESADGSSSLIEVGEVADENEITPSNEKHRFSLVSAVKSNNSPILRRRQTAFDSKIQNLLHEGKEFLHRKRQQVPLLSALGSKHESHSPSPSGHSSTNDASSHKDMQFGRSGSIVYRRNNDSITMESEQTEPVKTAKNLESVGEEKSAADAVGEEKPNQDENAIKQQNSSSTISSQDPRASSPPERPAALPEAVAMIRKIQGPGGGGPDEPNGPGVRREFPKPSFCWKHHKEIIGAVLAALTILEFYCGFRSYPVFFLGILWGWYLAYLVATVVFYLLMPPERYPGLFTIVDPSETGSDFVSAELEKEEKEVVTEDTVVYKGWMNRLSSVYDPRTYHVGNARSVLVRLDRNILRLSTPKTNIPRHVYCRDLRTDAAFISQEIFDITGANVVLRPRRLAHRRWWSRKYPISIILPPVAADHVSVSAKSMSKAHSTEQVEQLRNASEQANVGEVGLDAPKDEKRQSTTVGEMEGTDDETDTEDEGGQSQMHSTTSVPSDLGSARAEATDGQSGKRQRRRRRIINLFARSTREKEQWFYTLREAACRYTYLERRKNYHKRLVHSISDPESSPSMKPDAKEGWKKQEPLASEWILFTSLQRQYERHMKGYMVEDQRKPGVQGMDLSCMMWKNDSNSDVPTGVPNSKTETPSTPVPPMSIDWVNALGSRLFYDFSRNPQWIGKVRDRIQRKLATVRLPYFIETLTLKQLASGTTAPQITSIRDPSMNEWGLWIDTKLEYLGGLRLVLETKVNLMKLKTEAGPREVKSDRNSAKLSIYENDEIPESPESSPDEDGPSILSHVGPFHHTVSKPAPETPRESTGKKILNFVDKIAQSKYFQEATENKYLKKLMQGVSDTPLVLEVEVMYVSGALVVNIPPPPSDRLWYGFRLPPKVVLKARPRVGERLVNLSHITDWIENKLVLLLEKNLVIPNMDDLIVPIMSGSSLVKCYNQ